jgi:hypothetical protein
MLDLFPVAREREKELEIPASLMMHETARRH